jgi:hypothetical protein
MHLPGKEDGAGQGQERRSRARPALSVSVFRLGKTVLPVLPLRCLRTCAPSQLHVGRDPAPTRARPQDVSCFALSTMSIAAISRSGTFQCRCLRSDNGRHPKMPSAFRSPPPPAGAMVGRGGVEPPTSRLSGVRSNHLSYRPGLSTSGANPRPAALIPDRPVSAATPRFGCFAVKTSWWSLSRGTRATRLGRLHRRSAAEVVEPTGIEPVTSCLQSTRSPS